MKNQFQQYRNYLFSIAYRMLGSIEEAEDIVQETYLKIYHRSAQEVQNPKAYLATSITRLSLNRLEQLKKEREAYTGPWLPDPLNAPEIEEFPHKQSLSTAYLLLLEKLNPLERATFLLREAFNHSYDDIALILNKSADNCRQIFHRAKKRLDKNTATKPKNPEDTQQLLQRLVKFSEEGNFLAVKDLLVEEVRFIGDGGGKVRGAARNIISGADAVAKFMLGAAKKLNPANSIYEYQLINNTPTLVGYENSLVYLLLSINHVEGKVTEIFVLANPDKLKHLEKNVL